MNLLHGLQLLCTDYFLLRCRVLTAAPGQLYIKITSSDTVTQVGQQPKIVMQVRLTAFVIESPPLAVPHIALKSQC